MSIIALTRYFYLPTEHRITRELKVREMDGYWYSVLTEIHHWNGHKRILIMSRDCEDKGTAINDSYLIADELLQRGYKELKL